MKMIRLKLAVIAAALIGLMFAPSAQAQRGFDLWGATRRIIIVPPVQLTNGSVAGQNTNGFPFTNNITGTDLARYTGIAVLNDWSVNNIVTNTGGLGQQLTNLLQCSNDQTNWTTLTNCAFNSNLVLNVTNSWYGSTNLISTNLLALPGTNFTPSVATAGYSGINYGSVLIPNPFTNGGTWTANSGTNTFVAFNIDGMTGRYLRLIKTTGGQTITNIIVGDDLIVIPQQLGFP